MQTDHCCDSKLMSRLTQRELVELLHHEHAPLAVAQRCSGIGGSTPLFSALLNYRHSATDIEPDFDRAGVALLAIESWTNYPISLSVDDLLDGFAVTVKADLQIDSHRVMDHVCAAIQSLLEALERAPHTPALELEILFEDARRQLIEVFNATQVAYPQEKLIHELFEEQVNRTPGAVAVEYEDQSLTYSELNARSNQLARFLTSRGLCPDQLVALCCERSVDLVVGVLGILKARGAYVPLDPAYPSAQLAHMLSDSASRIVLTQERVRGKLPDTTAEVIALDTEWAVIAQQSQGNLDSKDSGLRSDHLAYVIYTSGSTGRPKGVMVEHRNVVKLWQSLEQIYRQSSECKRIAVNASFSFDASVKQWVQLLSGRTIVLIPHECRWDAASMLTFLDRNRVDGIDCTPSQLSSWIDVGLLQANAPSLRIVLVGGEPIDRDLWRTLAQCSETMFFNIYGPTECTVDATVTRIEPDTTEPHIGRPMENTKVYLLDHRGKLAPIAVAGEICIAGEGVARGYLNRPELTAERFVENPFVPNSRMYRTGDLGRWRPDGTIDYMGRNDDQVKIRGHRVELGEIETLLRESDAVRETAVIAREDVPGEKRLVAYVTTGARAPSPEELRAHLQAALPEHMVPSAFVTLKCFPLTPNRKLDRRALPAPELSAYASRQYEAPLGKLEEDLAKVWEELLRVERVGRHDNFFELGGHSLHGVRLIARIAERFAVKISVIAVFKYPTIERMAEAIASLQSTSATLSTAPDVELEEGII